eukprot:gb/GECG01015689.1/.p1 GENE.gb/GECG01015689.1/~~gb/GECG01015689.1/.p1  ORF type:complete len:121 (+),score=14.62 gb/GECG01015689.1/:1-363(+)
MFNLQVQYFHNEGVSRLNLLWKRDKRGKPPEGFDGHKLQRIKREMTSLLEDDVDEVIGEGTMRGFDATLYSLQKEDTCLVLDHFENNVIGNTKQKGIWTAIDVFEGKRYVGAFEAELHPD